MATIRTAIQLADNFSRPLGGINNAMIATIDFMQQMNQASGNLIDTSSLSRAQKELASIGGMLSQIEGEIQEADNAQGKFNNRIRDGTNAMDNLVDKVFALIGAYLSLRGIAKAITLSDEMTNLQARVQLLVEDKPVLPDGLVKIDFGLGDMSDLELAKELIHDAANSSFSLFQDTANMVARIGSNARDAFGSVGEVVAFTELVQKQFGIAGASAIEASNATLQLSQALASGVLRGDELNSIFEQAPNLIQTIADYMGEPIGRIRELAADGAITADIVKNAMFAATDEINAKFDSMPVTWSGMWTVFQNEALRAFGPVLQKLNDVVNSERFQQFAESATQVLYIVAGVAEFAMNMIMGIGSFIYDNWSLVGPLILGVAGILMTLLTYINLVRAAIIIKTAAIWAWNAALYANPIVWVVMAIVALIAIIYLVIGAINKFAGTSINATGAIAGAFALLAAFIWNTVIGVLNAVIHAFWVIFVEPWVGLIEWVLNVFNGGFNNFGDAVKNLLGQIISWFLSLGQVVTKIIDAIFGTDWTGGLSNLQDKVLSWGKNEDAITFERTAPIIDARLDYSDTWDAAYDWGANLFQPKEETGDTNALTQAIDGAIALGGKLDAGNDAAKKTAKNTGKMADGVKFLNDELKYLRDLAEREAINRFVTAEIKVDMTNNNNINSELDIDGIVDRFGEKVEEVAEMIAEGAVYDV